MAFPALKTLRLSLNTETSVLTVSLNILPSNVMTAVFWHECREIFKLIDKRDDVRCVIIDGGDARHFSTGLDLKEFAGTLSKMKQDDTMRSAIKIRTWIMELQDAFTSIEKCRQPVIAAIHGACIGAGLELAAVADIRIASEDAIFSIKEIDIGLAADLGALQRLPRLIGSSTLIKDWVYTGRTFCAKEALNAGLLSRVVNRSELCKTAESIANVIALKSPVAATMSKQVLNFSREHSTAEGLGYSALTNGNALQSMDVTEAMLARMEKRQPRFAKL